MMTETERNDVMEALGKASIAHRDVLIAIALAITLNDVPFQKQLLMLPSVNEILNDMGIARNLSKEDLGQYLKVARRAGLVISTANDENLTQTIVALTAAGKRLPAYYAEALSVSAVDPTDIPLVQWHLHRKRGLKVGERFLIRTLYAELQHKTQFAARLTGASTTMLTAYTVKVLKSAEFSQKLEICDGGTAVRVLESMKLF